LKFLSKKNLRNAILYMMKQGPGEKSRLGLTSQGLRLIVLVEQTDGAFFTESDHHDEENSSPVHFCMQMEAIWKRLGA